MLWLKNMAWSKHSARSGGQRMVADPISYPTFPLTPPPFPQTKKKKKKGGGGVFPPPPAPMSVLWAVPNLPRNSVKYELHCFSVKYGTLPDMTRPFLMKGTRHDVLHTHRRPGYGQDRHSSGRNLSGFGVTKNGG